MIGFGLPRLPGAFGNECYWRFDVGSAVAFVAVAFAVGWGEVVDVVGAALGDGDDVVDGE